MATEQEQAQQWMKTLSEQMSAEGHRILEYWRNNVLLTDGSFHGEVTGSGEILPNAPRGLVLAARILWTYARAITSGFEDTPVNRRIADGAYKFLRKHFWDPDYLGFYWLLDGNNQPLQDFKHVYGQSFAIYALAEYYRVCAAPDVLQLAQLTYQLVERHAADLEHAGYYESFTREWQRKVNLEGSPVNHGGPKSMNSHLHILEAYSGLYQVWPSPELKARLTALLDVLTTHVVDPEQRRYQLYFNADWTPLEADLVSFGHDIEGSWLMLEAAEIVASDDHVARCRTLALRMVDAVLATGLDTDYGILNEGRGNQIIDDRKDWWPQAEAVVGCVNAYQVSGDPRYLETAHGVWTFIAQHLLDRAHGEWHLSATRDGRTDDRFPKVSPWKCPYHNARACFEVQHRLTAQLANL